MPGPSRGRTAALLVGLLWFCALEGVASAQTSATGGISGVVRLEVDRSPVPGAHVLLLGFRRAATTDREGAFELFNLPPGTYELVAERDPLAAPRQRIDVKSGAVTRVEALLSSTAIHEEVTVTATAAGATSVFDAFSAVTTLDGTRLAAQRNISVADSLAGEAGVALRSFGANNTRPIIRGFDGDRVLIMEDGIRTGDLSSTSADHAVAIDPASVDRLEIVRGPATLFYGNNAIGGVVNAISAADALRGVPFEGVLGNATLDAGTSNELGGLTGGVNYGRDRWFLWAEGGTRRSSDYAIPGGRLLHSGTYRGTGRGGIGWTGPRWFGSAGVQLERNRFDIPVSEDGGFVVDRGRRNVIRADLGAHGLTSGPFESIRAKVAAIDYEQEEREVEADVVGTKFQNDTVNGRLEMEQRPSARLNGRLGVEGLRRMFEATGEEALAPRTRQVSAAMFGYEEITFGGHRVQIGGRVERTAYFPDDCPDESGPDADEAPLLEPPIPIERSFLGLSGSVGANLSLGQVGVLVGSVMVASRAPALEELYNFGPDAGNGTFEMGDPTLHLEETRGVEIGLRRRTARGHVQLSTFRYDIEHFVFLDVQAERTGAFRQARYVQADARFTGVEVAAEATLTEFLRVSAVLSQVTAQLVETKEYLPRIPPLSGRVRLELSRKSFTVSPTVAFAAEQSRIFRNETTTQGWTTLGCDASYSRRETACVPHTDGDRRQPHQSDVPDAHGVSEGRGTGARTRHSGKLHAQVLLNDGTLQVESEDVERQGHALQTHEDRRREARNQGSRHGRRTPVSASRIARRPRRTIARASGDD